MTFLMLSMTNYCLNHSYFFIFAQEPLKIAPMARIITENKNLMQSYIFTAAKYDFTAYEKRIMYRLVECAQDEIAGIKIKDNLHKIQPVQLGREITLSTSSILKSEKDENYAIAKKPFKPL